MRAVAGGSGYEPAVLESAALEPGLALPLRPAFPERSGSFPLRPAFPERSGSLPLRLAFPEGGLSIAG